MLASEIAQSIRLDQVLRKEGPASLTAFAEALDHAPGTTVEDFVRHHPVADESELVGLIAIELRQSWMRDVPCRVESYRERFAEIWHNAEQVLDLIYAEYCVRCQRAPGVEAEEYYRRFPEYREQLERLFCVHDYLDDDACLDDDAHVPEVGDEFLDFTLVRELGRGAMGHVFLARQRSLSDRLVVVKIATTRTVEHQMLARLRHPNIVPVYSVHPDELTGLQAVCMPYQSAIALSDIQATWGAGGKVPRRAAEILDAVNKLVPAELQFRDTTPKVPLFPRRASYVYATCWIMHRLADALAHAHRADIFHRDLKPSNILLTIAGQPLLVDFNLAFHASESSRNSVPVMGGTVPYMSPEQIESLLARDPKSASAVGPRSDIYSLAATFYELLTQRLPFGDPEEGEPRAVLVAQLERRYLAIKPARKLNDQIPTDLQALLAKCLDPVHERRYESAAELADDLRRFLEDRPLKHIGRVPKRQVVHKFVRRNRRWFATAGLLLSIGLVVVLTESRLADTKEQLLDTEEQLADTGEQLAETRENVEITEQTMEVKLDGELTSIPQNANTYFRRGYDCFQRNSYREAIYIFTKATELGDLGRDAAQIFFFRGKCHAVFDEDEEARDDYTRSIEANPNYSYIYHVYKERAFVYATSRKCANFELAIQDAEHALELCTDTEKSPQFLRDIARVYSAASRLAPEHERAAVLDRGKKLLVAALERGLDPGSIPASFGKDKYKSMAPLLELPEVQRLLQGANQHPRGN